MKKHWFGLSLTFFLAVITMVQPVHATPGASTTLFPIGSDYLESTLQRFAQAASDHDSNGTVNIVVLPTTYGTDAYSTSKSERNKNLSLADERRAQVEAACNAVKLPSQTCTVVLAPVLIRSDAYLQSNLDLFVADLDGIYVLGGDQTISMQVTANTPLEDRMEAAFLNGAVFGGNSAGAAVQSRNMINGYIGDFGPESGFQQGIVDLWLYDGPTDDTRGLRFGAADIIFEQHAFQRGRFARLLNAAFSSGLLGIGVDAETGAIIVDESTLTDVTGTTAAAIVDFDTYNATGQFTGPTNSLSLRHVATHIVPPGDFGFDLTQLQPLVNGSAVNSPSLTGRNFNGLHLPSGYGPLILAGDISGDRSGIVAQRFVTLSGGQSNARIVVFTLGYAKSAKAQAEAKAISAALQAQVTNPVQWFVIDSKTNQSAVQAALANATGIYISAPEQASVLGAFSNASGIASAIQSAWAGGKVLLADNAAAAALGAASSTDTTPTADSLESDSMGDFLYSGVSIQPGLNWLAGVAVEPRFVMDRHWGRAYNHLYRNSSLLVLGIDVNTAVEVSATGATAIGSNTVTLFDGRYGSYGLGTNDAISARYVILDNFVNGEAVTP